MWTHRSGDVETVDAGGILDLSKPLKLVNLLFINPSGCTQRCPIRCHRLCMQTIAVVAEHQPSLAGRDRVLARAWLSDLIHDVRLPHLVGIQELFVKGVVLNQHVASLPPEIGTSEQCVRRR